jgi:hypothetical protein
MAVPKFEELMRQVLEASSIGGNFYTGIKSFGG